MAILIVTFLGASICSVFDMVLHRYLIGIHNTIISQRALNIFLLCSWILPFCLIVLVDLVFGDRDTIIALSSDKMYCLHNLYSDRLDGIIGTILIFLFIFCTSVFQIFAYYRIVNKYLLVKAGKKSKSKAKKKASLSNLANIDTHSNEFRLIKKALAISGLFAIVWSVFVIKIIYEFWTKEPISFYYDIAWDIVGCCTPIINACILYFYDAKVKQNVNEIFFVSFAIYLYKKCIGIVTQRTPDAVSQRTRHQATADLVRIDANLEAIALSPMPAPSVVFSLTQPQADQPTLPTVKS